MRGRTSGQREQHMLRFQGLKSGQMRLETEQADESEEGLWC